MSNNKEKEMNPNVVVLDCGNGCCPLADFTSAEKVIVSDEGQVIAFDKKQIIEFVTQLLKRGYLD